MPVSLETADDSWYTCCSEVLDHYGVREYWIVDPESKTVSAHLLEDGKYVISVFGDEGAAPVHILEGCNIDLQEVFSV